MKIELEQERPTAAFSKAVCATIKQDIFEWTPENVRLKKSQYSTNASFDFTPWFKDPLAAIYGDDWDVINVVAGTGAGKSTTLQIMIAYDITFESGDILYITQNDGNAARFSREELQPTLERTLSTKDLMLSIADKDKTREAIKFPHMTTHTVGANMSSLQELSVQKVLRDECWNWNSTNLIGESKKRLHDRADGKEVNVSQAGSMDGKGSEWYDVAKEGKRMDYGWRCECGVLNVWDFVNLVFDKVMLEDEQVDWLKTMESVHMKCPTCSKTYQDTPSDRRDLLDRSEFIPQHNNHFPRAITYHIHSIAFPKIRWANVVGDFLKAVDAASQGNISPLVQLKNKVFSEFTKQQARDVELSPLTLGDYWKKDVVEPSPEYKRIMTVDVQGGGKSDQYYWAVIRDYDLDGSGDSALVYESMIADKAQILEVAARYKVQMKRLFLDAGYETEVVLEWCAEVGCYAMNGKHTENYDHGRHGLKLYSQPQVRHYNGNTTYLFTYAGDPIKDILAHLRDGAGAKWELPADTSKNYKRHLAAEEKQKSAKTGKWTWVDIDNGHNHLLDCEVMGIAAAMIHKVYPS